MGVRYKDKKGEIKEVLMDRWTNDMPWRLMQPTFLDQGKEFKKFIAEAKPGNEWPQSKLIDKIDRSEYGIVLIDFINHEIFSRNHYFTPGHLSVTSVSSAAQEILESTADLVKKGWVQSIERDISRYAEGWCRLNILPIDFVDDVNDQIQNKNPFLYDIILSDGIFNIDAPRGEQTPTIKETHAWLKKNGWKSKIDKVSFRDD